MAQRKAFLVRLNAKLHAELKAWAEQEMRSLNGQVEWLLREAVRKRKGSGSLDDETDAGDDRASPHD